MTRSGLNYRGSAEMSGTGNAQASAEKEVTGYVQKVLQMFLEDCRARRRSRQ